MVPKEMVEIAAKTLCTINNPYEGSESWRSYVGEAEAALIAALSELIALASDSRVSDEVIGMRVRNMLTEASKAKP